jgi:prephenate dehydratase
MIVAFQGERGAYSEAALLEHFGPGAQPLPCPSFDLVFEKVESGACDAGLVPIENSLAGSIHRNYDLLLQHQLHITGEQYLRVRHCLLGLPGASMEGIRTVLSHPQALSQCEGYIRSLPGVAAQPAYDTAGAARLVREGNDPSAAAIASRRAAEVYGMEILAEGIEDDPANFTRFLALSTRAVIPPDPAKTSIVFTAQNIPGMLFKALSVFALRDLDLTKIESRPLVGQPWDYFFYIDFAGSTGSKPVQRALEHLNEYAMMLRVLGSYPRQPKP